MKNVKAIIFDLGGVILNIDYSLTITAFTKLGVKNAELLYSKKEQNHIFDKIEIGAITPDSFLASLQKHCANADKNEIEKAWNSMLLDFPESRLNYIQTLSKNYRLFLLSNTNDIHMKALRKKIGEKKWLKFCSLFDKIYLSHEIGFRNRIKKLFKLSWMKTT